MPASDTALRRVSVHWDAAVVDVSLPAGIPVAVLIPSVVDILSVDHPDDEAWHYRLSLPGASGLDPSMTLAQLDIGDGAILVLSRSTAPLPAPRYFDVAEAVSAALDAETEPRSGVSHTRAVRLIWVAAAIVWSAVGGLTIVRNALRLNTNRDATTVIALVAASGLAVVLATIAHRSHQDKAAGLALSLIATAFAAIAGFVAVPGAPGMPNLLLAAAASGVTAIVAMRVSGCDVVTSTAVSICAVITAVAGLVGVIGAVPLRIAASAAALVSVGLLPVAARASIALAGLSPRPGTPEAMEIEPSDARTRFQAARADRWLTSLLAGLSASAALGAALTVLAGAPRLSCTAFGTLTGALLLLRSRSADPRKMLVFAICGILVTATTFGVAASRSPVPGPWMATATISGVAVAMYLGVVNPARPASPVLRRSVGVLELLVLTGMVPLTCWICGLYGAARGLNLA